jgi:DNA-binding transcriptional regulator YdaS (Cro superfamily)
MNAVELITNIKNVGKLWDSDIANLLQVSEHSVNMWFTGRTLDFQSNGESLILSFRSRE